MYIEESDVVLETTVEPVYNGHPWDFEKWLLNTGGLLIQDDRKYSMRGDLSVAKFHQHLMQEKNKTSSTISNNLYYKYNI